MSNKFSYFEDTYRFSESAIINSIQNDDKGYFITLDHTIFYPQGGGQPSDEGYLNLSDTQIPVLNVRMVNEEIRHYTNQDYSKCVGQEVNCHLNKEKRMLHAKLHTSGHLVSNILESLYPNYSAVKGHHFPRECYVEFAIKNDTCETIDLDLLNQKIMASVTEDLAIKALFVTGDKLYELCPGISYNAPKSQLIRVVIIGGFSYIPCGGTHVKTTSELYGLEVTKFKIKNNMMKISYLIKE